MARKRNYTRLNVESLERREMFAISSVNLVGSVLQIRTDNGGTVAQVDQVGTQLVLTENSPGNGFTLVPSTWRFTASKVTRIEFRGGAGRDNFVVNPAIPLHAWGGAGNDYLEGGNAADILYGEAGNDTLMGFGGNDHLYGGADNDKLYGGAGSDTLYGGDGHDSLFGGGWSEVDYLYGGAGRDRFLTQTGDRIMDGSGTASQTGEDAELRFRNSSSASWSDREIEVMDDAFTRLFAATGNNRLLKDSMSHAPLTFTQEELSGINGYNQPPKIVTERVVTKSGPWYAPVEHVSYRSRIVEERKIAIDEWDESSTAANNDKVRTMLHEIGHNWDEFNEGNRFVDKFRAVSGWVTKNPPGQTHYVSPEGGWYFSKASAAGFLGHTVNGLNYGKSSPYEDFATSFSYYLLNGRPTTGANSYQTAKLSLIDQFVRSMA